MDLPELYNKRSTEYSYHYLALNTHIFFMAEWEIFSVQNNFIINLPTYG